MANLSCDPDDLMEDAACIENCIPRGMYMPVLISVACQLLQQGGSGGGGQFYEGTAASPSPAAPADVSQAATYLGRNLDGSLVSLYIWSITLAQWVAIITP